MWGREMAHVEWRKGGPEHMECHNDCKTYLLSSISLCAVLKTTHEKNKKNAKKFK
jgi:hypothetical protein